MSAGYLLTCFKQRVLAEPASLAARLVTGGFFEETRRHEAAEMIRADFCAMLEELAELPFRISDPNWFEKIDADLRVESEGESGRAANPSEVKRKAEQARSRREKRNAAQRRRRAEGRA